MSVAEPGPPLLRFGPFELDLHTGELTRGGERVLLRPQATELLLLLARNRNRLVSRLEIQEQVWRGSIVEFDQGINACIRQIRQALGDDATRPSYIETIPRRGYRLAATDEVASVSTEQPVARRTPSVPRRFVVAAVLLLVAAGAAFANRILAVDNPALTFAVRPVAHNLGPDGRAAADEFAQVIAASLNGIDSDRIEVIPWHWEMRFNREAGALEDGRGMRRLDFLVTLNVGRLRDDIRIEMYVERIGNALPVWQRQAEAPFSDGARLARQLADEFRAAVEQNLVTESNRTHRIGAQ